MFSSYLGAEGLSIPREFFSVRWQGTAGLAERLSTMKHVTRYHEQRKYEDKQQKAPRRRRKLCNLGHVFKARAIVTRKNHDRKNLMMEVVKIHYTRYSTKYNMREYTTLVKPSYIYTMSDSIKVASNESSIFSKVGT